MHTLRFHGFWRQDAKLKRQVSLLLDRRGHRTEPLPIASRLEVLYSGDRSPSLTCCCCFGAWYNRFAVSHGDVLREPSHFLTSVQLHSSDTRAFARPPRSISSFPHLYILGPVCSILESTSPSGGLFQSLRLHPPTIIVPGDCSARRSRI